ncbi:MAG: hypothetical protein OXC19_19565 [Bryobacterales bacterium]|nr:hypothetical protein [Bryobacterales bacterium]
MPTVRLERAGLFGPVGVVDTADARRFTIRGVLQGASLLDPSASIVDPSLPAGPGPVIETRYQLAWFLAAQRHRTGRGLMLGLGGGCGAVGILHQFPGMQIDAVEADPAMTAMAREFHPLVSHYENVGRLRLHVADAVDYLDQAGSAFDFAIADLAVDGDSLGFLDSAPLIQAVAGAAPQVWFRVFGSLQDGEIRPFLEKFDQAGAPIDWLFSPVSVAVHFPRPRDWILAAGLTRPPGPDEFEPYGGVRGAKVAAVQEAYWKLVTRAVSARDAVDLGRLA